MNSRQRRWLRRHSWCKVLLPYDYDSLENTYAQETRVHIWLNRNVPRCDYGYGILEHQVGHWSWERIYRFRKEEYATLFILKWGGKTQ